MPNPAIKDVKELLAAFDEIQMPRPPYALEKLVVGAKFTPQQQYAQCVLELSIAYDNLRSAQLGVEKTEIEIEELRKGNIRKERKTEIEIELKQIDLEKTKRAMLGALREFEFLYSMWQKFPKKFTREELNAAQPEEYRLQLTTQAAHDKHATGRIGVSNQEGLRQIGILPYPELDVGRDVENRFLEGGKQRMMVAIPTEFKAEKDGKPHLPCIEGLEIPAGVEIKFFNSFERPVADSYNFIVETAIAEKCDYIVTIEDDTFPPPDAIVRLLKLLKENPNCAIGAWYPKKEVSRQGVHIVLKDGKREPMVDDGTIQEAYTLAMGCSIYPIEMFLKIPAPWFKTTVHLSQDSFFSQLAREAGYKLIVDTSIKCKHIDRVTGKVFE